MKASATSERNAETLLSAAQRPAAAQTCSQSAGAGMSDTRASDTGKNVPSVPEGATANPAGLPKPAAPKPAAPGAAIKKAAPAQSPAGKTKPVTTDPAPQPQDPPAQTAAAAAELRAETAAPESRVAVLPAAATDWKRGRPDGERYFGGGKKSRTCGKAAGCESASD